MAAVQDSAKFQFFGSAGERSPAERPVCWTRFEEKSLVPCRRPGCPVTHAGFPLRPGHFVCRAPGGLGECARKDEEGEDEGPLPFVMRIASSHELIRIEGENKEEGRLRRGGGGHGSEECCDRPAAEGEDTMNRRTRGERKKKETPFHFVGAGKTRLLQALG